jgi:hypothetical protein
MRLLHIFILVKCHGKHLLWPYVKCKKVQEIIQLWPPTSHIMQISVKWSFHNYMTHLIIGSIKVLRVSVAFTTPSSLIDQVLLLYVIKETCIICVKTAKQANYRSTLFSRIRFLLKSKNISKIVAKKTSETTSQGFAGCLFDGL